MKTEKAPLFDSLYEWTGNNVVVTAEALALIDWRVCGSQLRRVKYLLKS
jgi:hypothetical protein